MVHFYLKIQSPIKKETKLAKNNLSLEFWGVNDKIVVQTMGLEDFSAFCKNVLYLLIGLYTLVPQHNMLEYPGYWYEYLIVLVFGYCVIVSAQMVLQVGCRIFQPWTF